MRMPTFDFDGARARHGRIMAQVERMRERIRSRGGALGGAGRVLPVVNQGPV